MNIYFLRHAPTLANMTGEIVKDYNSYGILSLENNIIENWKKEVGVYLPNNFKIVCSPQKRCIDTAKFLFEDKPFQISTNLEEFDCSGIGNRKFWELSEEEFTISTHLFKQEMYVKIMRLLKELRSKFKEEDNVVCISHGFYIRTVISYMRGMLDTPLELLCSKNIKFNNLDLYSLNDDKIYHSNLKL
jgi:broad specificity phosphatase PhoE